jgi:hypothetical protein
MLRKDQQDVARAVGPKVPAGVQVGLPPVAAAQLLDRGDHQLALLRSALLTLLIGERTLLFDHDRYLPGCGEPRPGWGRAA